MIFIKNRPIHFKIKGALQDLRQFLATESNFEMIRMFFVSSKKLLLFLRYLNFCPDLFGHMRKWLDKNIYDFTIWLTNNCNAHILLYLKT